MGTKHINPSLLVPKNVLYPNRSLHRKRPRSRHSNIPKMCNVYYVVKSYDRLWILFKKNSTSILRINSLLIFIYKKKPNKYYAISFCLRFTAKRQRLVSLRQNVCQISISRFVIHVVLY